jgi:hypothetical protein
MAGFAWGGPLRPEWVASDATWVVHVDAEALATSDLGVAALAHGAMIAHDELDELRQELGIDVTKDIFGVTAFGVDEDDSTFSVILEATTVIDQLLAKAPEQMGAAYSNITEGDKTIHKWSEDGEDFFAYVKNSATPDRRLVLVSMDLLRLRDGMMRLEAKAPGANVAAPLAAVRPGAGSILFLSASELPGMHDNDGPAAAMMQNAKGLIVDVGETNGQFTVRAEVDTGDVENATNLLSMAQGLIAMGRMAGASEPDAKQLLPLLNALALTADGAKLRLKFEHNSESLIGLMELMEEHHKGHHDHHHDHDAGDEEVEVEVKIESKTNN